MADVLELVKKLREVTGVSMMACKKALDEAGGDYEKAFDELRKRGIAKAAEKSDRATGQGVIVSYVHGNKRVGALVQLACETDFVAKNDDFMALANDLAMQVVATNPKAVSPEEVNNDFIEKEEEIWREQLKNEGKPADKIEMIITNKEAKFREENALLKQPFVKNPDVLVEQLILDAINKLGENMKVVRFSRFEV